MLARLLRVKDEPREGESVKEEAGRLFASGRNCAESVLVATTGIEDPQFIEVAKAFGGGIASRKCVCGAVNGGVLALALKGKRKKVGELIDEFKRKNRVTCCSALSRPYVWKSGEHLANCRRLTEEAAEIVEELLCT